MTLSLVSSKLRLETNFGNLFAIVGGTPNLVWISRPKQASLSLSTFCDDLAWRAY
jgi:hypothetical protein